MHLFLLSGLNVFQNSLSLSVAVVVEIFYVVNSDIFLRIWTD